MAEYIDGLIKRIEEKAELYERLTSALSRTLEEKDLINQKELALKEELIKVGSAIRTLRNEFHEFTGADFEFSSKEAKKD
jgi:hypothetical protein